MLLYAVLNNIRVSPAKTMMTYWSEIFTHSSDVYVEMTSLVTRIASNIGLLENAMFNFIQTDRLRPF